MAFDSFVRPTSVTRSNTLGNSATDTISYHDNLNLWVLGQTARATTNNIETVRTDFNALAQPTASYQFGKLQSRMAYWADGNLKTVTDGNGNVTTLADYYRGVPRAIAYADGTAHTAVVDDLGRITQVTDQNGFATSYQYDAMGRLTRIDYPGADSTAWQPVSLTFRPIVNANHGLPAGHWMFSRYEGNKHTNVYYDALWRPVLEETLDASDIGGTLSQVVKRYDHDGRIVFQSYPQRGVDSVATGYSGTFTDYDALGRVTKVSQDSEHGKLVTTTEYLPSLQTRVTDPNGNQTINTYQMFDQPDYSLLQKSQMPEGKALEIKRDTFGKPMEITQRGPGS